MRGKVPRTQQSQQLGTKTKSEKLLNEGEITKELRMLTSSFLTPQEHERPKAQ